MHRLELAGELVLTAETGRTIALTANGSRVRLEVGDVPKRRTTLRLLRSSLTLARRLSRALHDRSLTLVVTRDGEPLFEIGTGVTGGLLARLLGIACVRLYRPKRRGRTECEA